MRAGPLRHRIEIHQPATQRDGGGAVVATSSLVGSRWGQILDLSGSERMAAGQMTGRWQGRIRLRYFAGLSLAHTLRKFDVDAPQGFREFEITAVLNPDGVKREHLCDVTEVV